MKTYTTVFFLMLGYLQIQAQFIAFTADDKASLESLQTKMFEAFCNGDVPAFKQLAGKDYITINANGTYMTLDMMDNYIPKFKGATYTIEKQETRYYDDLAVTTGRAKFFIKSIPAADVFFTQLWVMRDAKWEFVGWQGTMTGTPAKYPVYFTIIATLLVFGLLRLIIRRLRRRK